MYHHRVIINFRKTALSAPYFLHLLVDIPQKGNDLVNYPVNWKKNYIIAYGILGKVSNIDSDKVYDYHTAFDIKPTRMRMNVDLDMSGKQIINSPSIKPQIFAIPGKFDSSVEPNYIYFSGVKYLIAPVNCKMTKCFVRSETSLRFNLWLFVESKKSQNQHTHYKAVL